MALTIQERLKGLHGKRGLVLTACRAAPLPMRGRPESDYMKPHIPQGKERKKQQRWKRRNEQIGGLRLSGFAPYRV